MTIERINKRIDKLAYEIATMRIQLDLIRYGLKEVGKNLDKHIVRGANGNWEIKQN